MFENIIFDFDGTLADTVQSFLKAMRQVFQELDIFYDETIFNERIFVVPVSELNQHLANSIPSDKMDSALLRFRVLRSDSIDKEDRVYPGIENLLKELKSSGRKLFIATNSSKDSFAKKLELFFKESPFDDTRAQTGTKLEMIADLIAVHNLDKSKTVMVGDGLGDIIAGNTAKIKTIAVAYGYEPDKLALKSTADFYVETVGELGECLKK
ncbi:MAG: HAD family hydrolase [Alphaproteobacteria bacterium]|nr:HAD family hydrolase [Alphaproteobacteria bacterium]